ncbi:MAG: tyrosine-type recombinase/integrase, partial [Solirubrobacteraceae bacterium]
PKGLAPGVVERLLDSCDRQRLIGCRDYAVLLLLWRLGLRAGEVAAISLDDLNWRAGEVLVHGKAHREEAMPLPVDVGGALVAYLRRRPRSEHRPLFLGAQAPFGPISSDVVAMVVRRACRRAGLPEVGPHRLRHTTATEMLRAHLSLEEIAQVLRHRQLESTAHYARVDRDALRPLALAWPGDWS